jgi:hypothetical protein
MKPSPSPRRRKGRFSLPSAPWHSANLFTECPRKSTRQRRLCRCTVCRAFFVECHTRQSLCRVFLRLCRVLRALGKAPVSGSDSELEMSMGNSPTGYSISYLSPSCLIRLHTHPHTHHEFITYPYPFRFRVPNGSTSPIKG